MTVIFAVVGWGNGTYDSGTDTFTMATPDIPDAHTWTAREQIDYESGSPWNGEYVLNCATNWTDGAYTPVTSATWPITGRVLVQSTTQLGGSGDFRVLTALYEPTESQYRLRAEKSGSNLAVQFSWDNWSSQINVSLTWPSNPFNLEIIFDPNGAANADRLKARVWDIGSSPGSFTSTGDSSTAGGTITQPDYLHLGSYNNSETWKKYGWVVVSDDVDEDLSTWTPGGGSSTPIMGGMSL